eukprot:jgi/Bigna1/128230/aug1.6_g2938
MWKSRNPIWNSPPFSDILQSSDTNGHERTRTDTDGSSDAKRNVGDDERISSRRSSKAQMDSISKQIEMLREEKNKLNDRLARFEQFYFEGNFTKEELNEKIKKVEAQIAETQKEIQAK